MKFLPRPSPWLSRREDPSPTFARFPSFRWLKLATFSRLLLRLPNRCAGLLTLLLPFSSSALLFRTRRSVRLFVIFFRFGQRVTYKSLLLSFNACAYFFF